MDEILKETAKQAPQLTVLVIVVLLFLKSMKARDEQYARSAAARDENSKAIATDCHTRHAEIVDRLDATLQSSTEAIRENTEAIGGVRAHLAAVDRRLDRAAG